MTIPIRKFGQYVRIDIYKESGELIFSTDSLKIDFDIRHIEGWSRGKITVTNLAPETIKRIGSGENYLTLTTALHDSKESKLIDNMYISNSLNEKKLPVAEFNMYGYSKLRRVFLERTIDIQVLTPSIRRVVTECMRAVDYKGNIVFKHFPEGLLDYVPPRSWSRRQGSLLSVLERFAHEQRMQFYTIGNSIVFMYLPLARNLGSTSLVTDQGDILLSTTNMRSNPKLGVSTLKIHSNLDPNIVPSTVLDVSNLLTMGTSTSLKSLEVSENLLKDSVSGFSKYQTLQVQHKGSNWSGEWSTYAAATSPTKGITMNSDKWWL